MNTDYLMIIGVSSLCVSGLFLLWAIHTKKQTEKVGKDAINRLRSLASSIESEMGSSSRRLTFVGLYKELQAAFEIIYGYRTGIPLVQQIWMPYTKVDEWIKRNATLLAEQDSPEPASKILHDGPPPPPARKEMDEFSFATRHTFNATHFWKRITRIGLMVSAIRHLPTKGCYQLFIKDTATNELIEYFVITDARNSRKFPPKPKWGNCFESPYVRMVGALPGATSIKITEFLVEELFCSCSFRDQSTVRDSPKSAPATDAKALDAAYELSFTKNAIEAHLSGSRECPLPWLQNDKKGNK